MRCYVLGGKFRVRSFINTTVCIGDNRREGRRDCDARRCVSALRVICTLGMMTIISLASTKMDLYMGKCIVFQNALYSLYNCRYTNPNLGLHQSARNPFGATADFGNPKTPSTLCSWMDLRRVVFGFKISAPVLTFI